MTERLRITQAHRAYNSNAGLFGTSLAVAAGEIHAIVGLNGAGKTTLMRAIMGMLRLSSGTILLNGLPVERVPIDHWRQVGHLIDHPFAYPELTTRANLELASRLRGIPPADIPSMVESVLAELELDTYAEVPTRRLSQGNLQRLGLAVALHHDPELIVLDEPTNALDPAGVILVREALITRSLKEAGVLVSSHHLDEVARIADQISVVNRGRVIAKLDPSSTDLERRFFQLVYADEERNPA